MDVSVVLFTNKMIIIAKVSDYLKGKNDI